MDTVKNDRTSCVNIAYLNYLQEKRDITKHRLCGYLNIGRATYDSLLEGSDIRLSVLKKIADFYQIPLWTLIKGAPMDSVRINTSGPNSPGMVSDHSIYSVNGEDSQKEIDYLKKEIALKDELLELYRTSGRAVVDTEKA